jgi:hypothetical protein
MIIIVITKLDVKNWRDNTHNKKDGRFWKIIVNDKVEGGK